MSDIAYSVRTSERAKRVRVSVDPVRGVQVVLPAALLSGRRGSPERAERAAWTAVRELRPWIERRRAEQAHVRAVVAGRGDRVPYLGRMLAVVAAAGRTSATRHGDELLVPVDPVQRAAALERWYRRAARGEVAARLDAACAACAVAYTRLSVRGQRTRWASCSRSGAMSFNWRLLMAPEPVLDYVVWHEVCHLEVMDHSPRFWALVAARWPRYRQDRDWLRRHGATLVLPEISVSESQLAGTGRIENGEQRRPATP